ncbi:response regulator [Gorillibacterium massiliense]|uniref:response regulator n=1 Tax=Gorillibacterium massiliense TaxID=1280390 RepID=UPI0004AF4DEA|nr:response regulator [Gorillibacterium massiliense]
MYQLLIVDDQMFLADDLASMIPWAQHEISVVHKAYTAYDALEIIEANAIDILITDIRMPGMSGLELLGELHKRNRNIKCILLSGYADFEYAKVALKQNAVDYLLKPAEDDEIIASVKKAIAELKREGEEFRSLQRLQFSLRTNMPTLREHLLLELLRSRSLTSNMLEEKLEMFHLPFTIGSPYCMLLIRLDETFSHFDSKSVSLYEYAICNIAEEIFSESYHLWYCKDSHDYLVLLLTPKISSDESGDTRLADLESLQNQRKTMEHLTTQLQHNVKNYLRGTISALLSPAAIFPEKLDELYDSSLSTFRLRIGGEEELLMTVSDDIHPGSAKSLSALYAPPTLLHLLEAGQWNAAKEKLDTIFDELRAEAFETQEHILETYFVIAGAMSYIIHKSGKWMSGFMDSENERHLYDNGFKSAQQLKEWSFRLLDQLRQDTESQVKDTRNVVIKQVHEFVSANLSQASLQNIASHVHLNPSYLSKVYKVETGEGISDYLFRMKMERAAYLLKETSDKIYEIAEKLGYMKTSYFIKLFKENFNLTPQEYRDSL